MTPRHSGPYTGGSTKNTLTVTPDHVKANYLATHWVKRRARKTIEDTISYVEAYALADNKGDTPAEAKDITL